jgi:hypothetical protein
MGKRPVLLGHARGGCDRELSGFGIPEFVNVGIAGLI